MVKYHNDIFFVLMIKLVKYLRKDMSYISKVLLDMIRQRF